MKRTVLLTITCFIITVGLYAQKEYKHSMSGIKKVQIVSYGHNIIKAINGDELIIKSEDCCGDEDNLEKRKGLKPIYAGGTDNTELGFYVEKEGDVLKIKDLRSHHQRDEDNEIHLPKNVDFYLDAGNLGDVAIEGFSSEIEVKANIGDIELKDVTGPVTAHTNTGDVDVVFVNVNQSSPISLSSSTGDIDVSLPTNTKANLELKSTMGTIYTNFDLELPQKDDMKAIGAVRKISSKLNSGGVEINLRSSTGDIYLRKRN